MAKTKQAVEEAVAEKYPISVLRSNCMALFGCTSSTFDGATKNLDGEYSVEDMNTIITNWLNEPIGRR